MKHLPLRKTLCLMLCIVLSSSIILGAFAEESQSIILTVGSKGDDVLKAQQRLSELGYYDGEINGVFDEALQTAVLNFQIQNQLLETGELDKTTISVLMSEGAVGMPDWFTDTPGDVLPGASVVYEESYVPYMTANVSMNAPYFTADLSDFNTSEYTAFSENRFLGTSASPLSTFAADVDTASYAQLRSMILKGESVPQSAVRIEEMLNYFRYEYAKPKNGEPFGVTMEVAQCPWNKDTKLMLIGLQAEELPVENRARQNLVFLIDVSGSMDEADKLPLVKRAFLQLLENLSSDDTVSIVTYASSDEVVLDGVSASRKPEIMEAINFLTAGGMTAGAAGIKTAYEIAQKHFIEGGKNRILLATDGHMNIGTSNEGEIARQVSDKRQSGVYLSVFGFGDGNYMDNKLEALADYGNGNYHYIDTIYEARKALIDEGGGTFFTVCKDVKLQIDFNPAQIKGYRLIGYEDRLMAAEDFADDTKDGGEIGSGHRVTVLYELVPADSEFDFGEVESKYQAAQGIADGEWLTLSIRSKKPDSDESELFTYPLEEPDTDAQLSDNMRCAAAVAEVGMLLRNSQWKGDSTYSSALELLRSCSTVSGDPYKEEFVYMVTLLERMDK